MSEFLAEAQVLIRPNTTSFRATLQAELLAAAKGVTVPVAIAPIATSGFGAVSTSAAAAAGAFSSFGDEAVRGADETRKLNKELGNQAKQMAQLEKAAIANTAGLLGLRGAVLTAGTAFIGATVGIQAFIKAVQSAAELEQQLNVFRVTAGATADEMKRVSEEATRLGRDITLPGVNAQDAAQAMTEFAKAGLSVRDAMDAARGGLQLATAAQIDNVAAVELIANALNAFALSGEEAVRVADLLTGASLEAQGSITDMGIALRQVAAVASLVGLSVDDTVTLLTQLAQAGLAGSDAGTSLRTALLRLTNTKAFPAVNEELQRLNINLRDLDGNIRPEAFGELGRAIQGLAPAQRQATVAILGGSDAVRAFGILARQSSEGFREMRDAVTEQGLAAQVAGAQTEGFAGQLEALRNQLETLGTTIGQLTLGPLSLLVTGLSDVAAGANSATLVIKELVDALKDVPTRLGDIVPFADKAESAFEKMAKTGLRLQFLGPVMTAASLAIERFGDSAEEAAGKLTIFDTAAKSVVTTINQLKGALDQAAQSAALRAQGLTPEQIGNRLTGFDAQQVRAKIRDSNEDLLRSLEEERTFLEQQLQRGVVRRRPALQRQLENELLSVLNEIQSINDSATRAKEQAASDIEKKQREADQRFLDALGIREARLRNAELIASSTARLQDDLRAQESLRNFFKKSRDAVAKTVSDGVRAAQERAALTEKLLRAEAEIDRIEKEIQQRRREQRQAARERARESLALDVQIAQATGNRANEIRARQAEIDFLKEQIRNTRRNTLQRKRLILELREAQKSLRELQAERQKTSDISKQVFFDFLQKQQGFAANLLGNLIPGFATAGLVGGQQPGQQAALPPQRALTEAAAVTQVQGRGITQGQGDTQVQLLRAINDKLGILIGKAAVPEARYQRQLQHGFMDVIN